MSEEMVGRAYMLAIWAVGSVLRYRFQIHLYLFEVRKH